MIALAAALGLALGLLLAQLAWPRDPRFVRAVRGVMPRWAVDHHASEVARALAGLLRQPREQEAVIAAIRRCRVRVNGVTARIGPRGRVEGDEIVVDRGEHWPRDLADALAHVARHALTGDPDRQRADRAWFAAARTAVGYGDLLVREAKEGHDG